MSKLLSQIKLGLFLGLCVFGLLILLGYIKPERPTEKPLFHLRMYNSEEKFRTDFTKMIWEGYEVQHMSYAIYADSRVPDYWTVIYVKRR